MIFELLRCSTFDKLEDGILHLDAKFVVGICDWKFDKLK
jgi:hypothetical protein